MGRVSGGDPADVALAFEHLPAIVWMLEGPEHTVVAANGAARRSVGDLDLMGMPLRLAGPALPGTRLLGMLDEVFRSGRPATTHEQDAVVSVLPRTSDGDVTGLIVQAVDIVRDRPQRRTEHEITLDLQRVVLPDGLPVLPEISMAAAYVPAATDRTAGGDWFEVVPMPDRRLGLVVGDVVGHGATASAIMGQLRAIAAERLLLGGDLRDVVTALDAFSRRTPEARGTTICVAILDRGAGALEYCTRGHPPPLVVSSNGETRVLPQPSGPPLAFGGEGDFRSAEDVLLPGETILLYSDGAVEWPGRTIVDGIGELAFCAGQAVRANGVGARMMADRICQSAVELIEGGPVPLDDASLLAVTVLLPFVEPLVLSVPADPRQLTEVRRRLGHWLTDLRLTEDDLVAVELSVIEAVTNSIEHAYSDQDGGAVLVEASLDEVGHLKVIVSDTGIWRTPDEEPGFRGRGMLMMRESMDEMRLSTTSKGTVVEMAKLVRRPVRAGATRVAPAKERGESTLRIDTTMTPDSLWLSVVGPLDADTAALLRSSLLEAARGGKLPITLLLDDVTVLGSAGLRVLTEQGKRLGDAGRMLRVVAAPSSTAGNVLSISGVDMLLNVRSHA